MKLKVDKTGVLISGPIGTATDGAIPHKALVSSSETMRVHAVYSGSCTFSIDRYSVVTASTTIPFGKTFVAPPLIVAQVKCALTPNGSMRDLYRGVSFLASSYTNYCIERIDVYKDSMVLIAQAKNTGRPDSASDSILYAKINTYISQPIQYRIIVFDQ